MFTEVLGSGKDGVNIVGREAFGTTESLITSPKFNLVVAAVGVKQAGLVVWSGSQREPEEAVAAHDRQIIVVGFVVGSTQVDEGESVSIECANCGLNHVPSWIGDAAGNVWNAGRVFDDLKAFHKHDSMRSPNGRLLRHRPKRSERCLNYERFYQGQPASPNMEGAPKALA